MVGVLELLQFSDHPRTFVEEVIDDPAFGYCVLKHRPRGNPGMFDPDEFIFQGAASGTQIGNGIPFKEWWDITYRINKNFPGAWEWLTDYEAMFFNNDQAGGKIDITKPVNIRSSSGGGNLKRYYKSTETETHVQIAAFDYLHPEYATGKDFYTDPDMFTFPVCINEAGVIRRMTTGITVFVPQVARYVDGMPQLWARKENIIKIEKPFVWGIADVMDSRWI